MKLTILKQLTIVVLAGCMLTVFGCNRGSGSVGKYVSEKAPSDFTELRSDGTFFIQQGAQSASGKYVIEGKRLILTLPSGEVVEGTIEGNTIIDNTGVRATKQ